MSCKEHLKWCWHHIALEGASVYAHCIYGRGIDSINEAKVFLTDLWLHVSLLPPWL